MKKRISLAYFFTIAFSFSLYCGGKLSKSTIAALTVGGAASYKGFIENKQQFFKLKYKFDTCVFKLKHKFDTREIIGHPERNFRHNIPSQTKSDCLTIELIETMVTAINLTHFCIRLATEIQEEIGESNFKFHDQRFYCPGATSFYDIQQGVAIVFENDIPSYLMTPLGDIQIIGGGCYSNDGWNRWADVKNKLKEFLKVTTISETTDEHHNTTEIFAVEEFDCKQLPSFKNSGSISFDLNNEKRQLWKDLLQHLETTLVLNEPWILEYYKFYNYLLSRNDRTIYDTKGRKKLFNDIAEIEKAYWETAPYPCHPKECYKKGLIESYNKGKGDPKLISQLFKKHLDK